MRSLPLEPSVSRSTRASASQTCWTVLGFSLDCGSRPSKPGETIIAAEAPAPHIHACACQQLQSYCRASVAEHPSCAQDPIDLGTIRKRVLDGSYYRTLSLFTADIRHICHNARVYNAADTVYYKMADKLEALYDSHLNSHLLIDSSITRA